MQTHAQIAHRAPSWPSGKLRCRSTDTADVERSVGALDRDVAMNIRDMISGASDRHRFICRLAGPGAAGQPYDAILVGADMNTLQACDVPRSQLALDLGGDCRVLHECHRMRTVGRRILVRNGSSGSE